MGNRHVFSIYLIVRYLLHLKKVYVIFTGISHKKEGKKSILRVRAKPRFPLRKAPDFQAAPCSAIGYWKTDKGPPAALRRASAQGPGNRNPHKPVLPEQH